MSRRVRKRVAICLTAHESYACQHQGGGMMRGGEKEDFEKIEEIETRKSIGYRKIKERETGPQNCIQSTCCK